MKIFIVIIIIMFCICTKTNAQYQVYQIDLKGTAKATINGQSDVCSFTFPTGVSITNCLIKVSHPFDNNTSAQNSQNANLTDIYCSSSKFDRYEETDYYGNSFSKFTQEPGSSITSNFIVQQSYNATTEAILTNGFKSSTSFLTPNVPAAILAEYGQPTTNIQSNNPEISTKAHNLSSGCSTVQDAVKKIAQWVFGTIEYKVSSNENLDMDAMSVFYRKSGNCAGYTNLTIAMLRSVGIPARYLSGFMMPYPYYIKFLTNNLKFGDKGPDSHAIYEVYYTDKGWVMADPQGSLNFNSTHFVRHMQLSDPCEKLLNVTATAHNGAPILQKGSMCGSITSFENKYAYANNYSIFQSVRPVPPGSVHLFLNVFPGYATGINDIIEITSGTSNFKAGEDVFYNSTFTSYGGNTWPLSRSWSIVLYHTNGTYLYASQDNPQQLGSSWGIKTNPILPDYQWLLDGNGNIFGEAQVVALLNDGDIIYSDKMPLSIARCNELTISNQTYTASATIAGCYVTMNNVSVQNNSNLIVDSEMGVTINGDINVNVGSVFEARASEIFLVPTLASTSAVSFLTCTSATSGGNVTSDGGRAVVIKGVCWNTSPNPTTNNSKVITGSDTGPFSATISPLVLGTTYYFRSFASNSVGTGYGSEVTYTPNINLPILDATVAACAVTTNSATSGGNVTSDGCGTITERGICWSTTFFPTTANSTYANGSGTGTFTGNLTGLTGSTTYYVRSYATNSAGTEYGAQTWFTTLAPPVVVPTLAATNAVTAVTCTTAYSGGNVTSDGWATVTARGVCWATTPNPTIANSKTTDSGTTGPWTSGTMTLVPGTLYYVRAYATNSAGTGYGTEVIYTQSIGLPQLATTTTASSITYSSAISGGNVTSDGCGTITARGICWATTQNPTTANSTSANGSGIGTYTGNLTGLTASTTYYVRSYAINSAGTAYGVQTSFTTLAPPSVIPTLAATTTATSIAQTTAISGGNVTSDGGATVTERGICWSSGTTSPTKANSYATSGSGTGSYTVGITGLSPDTTYYVRSYAINSAGTGYGGYIQFTTAGAVTLPTLGATISASAINWTTAQSGGNIISDGGSTVSNRGICWSTSSSPTTANSTYTTGTGTGSFSGYLTGLSAGTTYYIRSFATNSAGTGYGTQVSFTTLAAQIPSVAATTAVTNISATSATSGGNITSGNGSAATARGVCWSTSSNPTIANSKTIDGSGGGVFISSITGLSPNTLYYVRAYATNGVGTGYGSQVSFTSLSVGITASISYQVFDTQPTAMVVGWFANLTSPAPSGNTIPAIITNASGSGTHTASGYVAQGQASQIMIETVYYSRLAGSNYTATCSFGTMPAGYIAGATGSVTIPKQ